MNRCEDIKESLLSAVFPELQGVIKLFEFFLPEGALIIFQVIKAWDHRIGSIFFS